MHSAEVPSKEKYEHSCEYRSIMEVVTDCTPSHWISLSRLCSDNKFSFSNLLAIPSLRSHYVRLPNPGEAFTAM